MPTIIDKAQEIARAIDHVMADELKLQPPVKYQLLRDGNFILILAVIDEKNLRGSIRKYTNEDLLHQLSTAVNGLPVVLSNHSGVRYAVSMTGKPRLPKMVRFPGHGTAVPLPRDEFALGVSLRGHVELQAAKMMNMLIGGSQDSGKSMVLRLLAHTARLQSARLYVVDPVAHTFNPDLWNALCAAPVATTRGDLLSMLDLVEAEIEARVALFRAAAVQGITPEDLDEYNRVADPLPRIHLIGDEMNTYLSDRLVREGISDLARKGRKWGIHVTMAAHNWRAEDISRGLSTLFPTRLCLRVADDTSGNVTLSSYKWGKMALRFKHPGRAVLFANGRYQKMQLYYVSPEQERAWLGNVEAPSPLPEDERKIVLRSLQEAGGRMSIPLLKGWGMEERQARSLVETYEKRGWLSKEVTQGNARYVTPMLKDLLSNRQTGQTASSPEMRSQTASNPPQTPYLAGA